MNRPFRILYVTAAGDVVGTYRHWLGGHDDPSQIATTYSGQFFDLCKRRGFVGTADLALPAGRPRSSATGMTVENRPVRFGSGPGPLYHLGQLWYGLRLAASRPSRSRADMAVVADRRDALVRAVATAADRRGRSCRRCTACSGPRCGKPTGGRVSRIVGSTRSTGRFFRRRAAAALSLSDDITDAIAGDARRPCR